MYRVITIAREYGAGGLIVAEKVAAALGWELLDKSLVKHVAGLAKVAPEQAAKVDECPASFMERLSRSLWLGVPDSSAPVKPEVFGADRCQELAARCIQEKAAAGSCVIVGRGSQCILRERRDTLKVFLHAPLELRVRQLRAQYESDEETAQAIERVDRVRAAFVQHYFHCDWRDASLYDLVINTSVGLDMAAGIILDVVRAAAEKQGVEETKSA